MLQLFIIIYPYLSIFIIFYPCYPLIIYLTSPWYRWPIEIDGLPNLKMVIFHGYVSHNQMVKRNIMPITNFENL